MNTNFARAKGLLSDGWPILVYAIYAMAFCIFAMTLSSAFPVA